VTPAFEMCLGENRFAKSPKQKTAKLVTWRLLRELETDYTFYASFKRGGFGPYFKSVELLSQIRVLGLYFSESFCGG
jgi:hypothetical protein